MLYQWQQDDEQSFFRGWFRCHQEFGRRLAQPLFMRVELSYGMIWNGQVSPLVLKHGNMDGT